MDAQLRAQCASATLISNPTTAAANEYGELTYGASTTALARIINRTSFIRNTKGEQVTSNTQLIYPSSIDVRINSRIYLPGESTSADQGWVPVALALRYGETGSSDHWKVWL